MNATIEKQDLERLLAHYQDMMDVCGDSIKQLTGQTPEKFSFIFAINDVPIVRIPIGEEDGNFCVGMFMGWYQFYSRKFQETAAILRDLPVRVAV